MAQLRKRREKTFHLKSDYFPQYSLLIGLLLLVALLPARGFSLELNCTVTSSHGRTSYRVSDSEDFDCDYHWSYANQTLATSEGKMDDLVDYKNETLLKTYKCYDKINYVKECDGKQDKTANCSATCHAEVSNKAGTRHHWVTLGVFTTFFVFGGILFTRYCR